MAFIEELAVKVGGKLVLGAIVAGVVAVAVAGVVWKLGDNQRNLTAAAVARVSAVQGQAGQKAATDAVAITDAHAQAAEDAATITRNNQDEIKSAPGADTRLDPGLARAGLNGLCRRAAYRRQPQCLHSANP